MRRLLSLFCAALCTAGLTPVASPSARADVNPWFAQSVGNASQVISVVGVGGSDAKMDVYQRGVTG